MLKSIPIPNDELNRIGVAKAMHHPNPSWHQEPSLKIVWLVPDVA